MRSLSLFVASVAASKNGSRYPRVVWAMRLPVLNESFTRAHSLLERCAGTSPSPPPSPSPLPAASPPPPPPPSPIIPEEEEEPLVSRDWIF